MNKIDTLLSELRALAEKATPPEWEAGLCIMDGALHSEGGEEEALANANLIAALRNNHDLLERIIREQGKVIGAWEAYYADKDVAARDGLRSAQKSLAAVEERVWGKEQG